MLAIGNNTYSNFSPISLTHTGFHQCGVYNRTILLVMIFPYFFTQQHTILLDACAIIYTCSGSPDPINAFGNK